LGISASVSAENLAAFELLIMSILTTLAKYSYGGFRETSETTEFGLDFSAGLKLEESSDCG